LVKFGIAAREQQTGENLVVVQNVTQLAASDFIFAA
jgi:hypothetical protein